MEATNKNYLLQIHSLFAEKNDLKTERNTAVLVVVQLRRENCLPRAHNNCLKEDAAQAFNDANEALNEVIDTSKTWVVKAFEMVAEAEDVPRYERHLDFQESLHRAMVTGDEPPIFQESSYDEDE